jgi:hypothetical protein
MASAVRETGSHAKIGDVMPPQQQNWWIEFSELAGKVAAKPH